MGGSMVHFSCHMHTWVTINSHLSLGGELQHSAAFRFRSSEMVTDTGLKVPCRVREMDTVRSVMMLNAALLFPTLHSPLISACSTTGSRCKILTASQTFTSWGTAIKQRCKCLILGRCCSSPSSSCFILFFNPKITALEIFKSVPQKQLALLIALFKYVCMQSPFWRKSVHSVFILVMPKGSYVLVLPILCKFREQDSFYILYTSIGKDQNFQNHIWNLAKMVS